MTETHFIDKVSDTLLKALNLECDEDEPEFKGLSIKSPPTLRIWRIEKSTLQKWPESKYGIFYEGDSYLILKINSIEDKNAHVWIGKKSTADETGIVSFKVLQLDRCLAKTAKIFYESQGYESDLFLSYFPYINVFKGGVDADLLSEKSQKFKPRLFHINSHGSNIKSREVPINKKSLDRGDVYLFDLGLKIFNWRGSGSNGFEKYHGSCFAEKIKEKRNNKIDIITIDEGSLNNKEDQNEFDNFIKRYEEDYDKFMENEVGINYDKNFKKMMKLSDESGNFCFSEVEYSKNSLDSKDNFIIDRGDAVVIWIGKKCSGYEKRFSNYYAKRYLRNQKRNEFLPIIVCPEGNNDNEVNKCFC